MNYHYYKSKKMTPWGDVAIPEETVWSSFLEQDVVSFFKSGPARLTLSQGSLSNVDICGVAASTILIADNVRWSLEEIEASGVCFEEVTNVPDQRKWYWLRVVGVISVDIKNIIGEKQKVCPVTHAVSGFLTFQEKKTKSLIIKGGDDSDFAMMSNFQTGHRFCSDRIVALAKKEKWRNWYSANVHGVPYSDWY